MTAALFAFPGSPRVPPKYLRFPERRSPLDVRPAGVYFRQAPRPQGLLKKPGGSWTFVVLDDMQRADDVVRDAARWMRRTYGARLPEPVYVDAFSPELLALIERRFACVRRQPLPAPPEIDWQTIGGRNVPSRALHWWKRLLVRSSPAGNQLVTLVLPETARTIFEIVDGSSAASWRDDPRAFAPGASCRITSGADTK